MEQNEEIICDACGGVGAFPNGRGDYCEKCDGTGTVNWLENVFGKRTIHRDSIFSYYKWDEPFDYVKGAIVSKDSKMFICITANMSNDNNEPGIGKDWKSYWREIKMERV